MNISLVFSTVILVASILYAGTQKSGRLPHRSLWLAMVVVLIIFGGILWRQVAFWPISNLVVLVVALLMATIIGRMLASPSALIAFCLAAALVDFVHTAAAEGCRLVAFGEALVPGYPFWIERTDGARFNSPVQKEIYAHYLDQAVQIEAGHLQKVCDAAAQKRLAVVLGCVERPSERGGHSLYCSLVFVDADGEIQSVHRKLMPTYEERLTWAPGDGHGLQVHRLGAFTVGGLNCWENWMPLARTALYAMGEDLHVAIWPGSSKNTTDITRFIAQEARSYVLSVSGLMRQPDFPKDTPHLEKILANGTEMLANGGSCLAGPDGEWVVEPVVDQEKLLVATIDHRRVRAERQNFDPVGHYSRPDVLQLTVDRRRQRAVTIKP